MVGGGRGFSLLLVPAVANLFEETEMPKSKYRSPSMQASSSSGKGNNRKQTYMGGMKGGYGGGGKGTNTGASTGLKMSNEMRSDVKSQPSNRNPYPRGMA